MNPILKNILAILVGAVIGSTLNMGMIMLSGSIIPPPAGTDSSTLEGLIESMHLFEPRHFIFPFLAHALGTLSGAFLTAILAASHQLKLALLIGVVFMAGGIYMVIALPSPMWFTVLDIGGAYIPMAYFGWKLANATKNMVRQNQAV